ncbi:tripartite tricarboxylate transporter substrate binding protein [Roseococcus sp. SYP-B2431]|uniref:Bug family tripartite tricarboxylate transporter substrate binding protein n=1 Tax=Roseococcus sp. SYP-B2431 TaxID=2496640 RepID=UPI0013F41605|nr:tripartite tricarboxylate transporter substrate binding protein [Roseococcus sp. SYP-B2431]
MRRRTLPALGITLGAFPALAQEVVSRPIRMVVPFAQGGTTDLLARLIAERSQAEFGQPMVVDIRPGASGTIGAAQVAQSRGDGTTLLMGAPPTHATARALFPNLPYDPVRDFAPVALVATLPNLVAVNNAVPVRSIAELIAWSKAHPGTINYGSAGNGATTHLSGELLKLMTGADVTHIPYRGSGAALIDLLGGQIQLMFENLPSIIDHVREGRLRGLAVTSPRRSPSAPEIPTVAETVPGYEALSWFGIFAPAGTPAPLVLRLHQGIRRIMADPAVRARFVELGAERADGPPGELAELVRADAERWGRVIREARITIQ